MGEIDRSRASPKAASCLCIKGKVDGPLSGFAALAAWSPLSDLPSDWNVSCRPLARLGTVGALGSARWLFPLRPTSC